ncbi:MAG TPA: DegV family protein [Ktedonobacteraceae bacterium]|nr:DegV family protein [Ktedonobacteraceae bacterium]
MAVRIVTDSTADIPPAVAEKLDITVVPLTVFFGEEAYLDGVELDNASFYRKLQASKELPTTSQPSPAAFEEAYERLIKEGATGILSVHLSSQLSGTYQSARTAVGMLPEDMKNVPIEVVDSESISVGMSVPIMKAAEEAQAGHSLEEISANLLDRLARTRILAVLDTLEYVRRGGRIGSAGALLGNMLSFKPIISLKEGKVIPLERPRTRSKAYERIAQLLKEMGPLESVVIAESSEEVGQQLRQALKAAYPGEIATYKLGGVLGTHTGPGTAAISIITAKV